MGEINEIQRGNDCRKKIMYHVNKIIGFENSMLEEQVRKWLATDEVRRGSFWIQHQNDTPEHIVILASGFAEGDRRSTVEQGRQEQTHQTLADIFDVYRKKATLVLKIAEAAGDTRYAYRDLLTEAIKSESRTEQFERLFQAMQWVEKESDKP